MKFIYPNIRKINYLLNEIHSDKLIVCDKHTRIKCLSLLNNNYPVVVLPVGETAKNLESIEIILEAMVANGCSKSSTIVNLGGGVISDIGGFAASIYQRGIDYINIPTTLMAMADAAYGGKTGVNFGNLKNYFGTFKHPKYVYICTTFLKTLSEREIKSGFAEILKHSFLKGEPFNYPSDFSINDNNLDEWSSLIKISNTFKWKIVQEDFNDTGIRRTLNFGHTAGHAIESLCISNRQPITHGEAVAAGMIIEFYLSNRLYGYNETVMNRNINLIRSFYPKIHLLESNFSILIDLMAKDKKNQQHQFQFSLFDESGSCTYNMEVSDSAILDALNFYNAL